MSNVPVVQRIIRQVEQTFSHYFQGLPLPSHRHHFELLPASSSGQPLAHWLLNPQGEQPELHLHCGNILHNLTPDRYMRAWWTLSRETAYLYCLHSLVSRANYWRRTPKWQATKLASHGRWLKVAPQIAVIYVASQLLQQPHSRAYLDCLQPQLSEEQLKADLREALERQLATHLANLQFLQRSQRLTVSYLALTHPLPEDLLARVQETFVANQPNLVAATAANRNLAVDLRTCNRLINGQKLTRAEIMLRPLSDRALQRLAGKNR